MHSSMKQYSKYVKLNKVWYLELSVPKNPASEVWKEYSLRTLTKKNYLKHKNQTRSLLKWIFILLGTVALKFQMNHTSFT